MRIAYVSREFGPITGGNIGAYISHVTRCMARRGHEIYLVTDCFSDTTIYHLPEGVTLVPVKSKQSDRRYISSIHEYSEWVYHTLRDLSHSVALDVIEFAERGAEGFITIRAKKLLDEFSHTKLVVQLHTPTSLLSEVSGESPRDFQKSIQIYAEHYCIENADILTSPSQALVDYLKDKLGIQTVFRRFSPLSLAHEHEIKLFTDSQVHTVIFVGSLHASKGVDLFIQAAQLILARDSHFTFEIYGKDTPSDPFGNSYKEYIKRRIPTALDHKILFRGFVPYREILKVLSNACFCILPARWASWPYACLEAMSLGCVVVGSKHGGMPEIIEHGVSGFLADPLDPTEIAHTVLDNYTDLSRLQKIAESAHTKTARLCDPLMACQKIEECYNVTTATKTSYTQKHAPRVSVIVPLYNQGRYVQEAIDSVKASTYNNVEIIVVNDGSTDEETHEVFDGLEGVMKVRKPNGGLSSARNAGIAVSSGQFIMPLDADDKIHHLYIEKAVRALLNNSELAYVTCYSRNFGAFESVHPPIGYVPDLMLFMNTSGRSMNLYRKEALKKVNGYDEEMISYEDWDLLLSLHEKGFIGDVLPIEMSYYRRHSDSMVYTITNSKRSEIIQYMLCKHHQLLEKHCRSVSLNLVDLWKKNYQVNESIVYSQSLQ
ncbi:MAG: glycosyltransferase [Ktedonobacteraceae bacterium]|nr:glycosyltransferase [Ktedonobacteraceae bacterium]